MHALRHTAAEAAARESRTRTRFELHGLTAWPTAASASHCERELPAAAKPLACCAAAATRRESRGEAALARLSIPGDRAQHMAGAPASCAKATRVPGAKLMPPS